MKSNLTTFLCNLGYQPQTSRQNLWQKQGDKTFITVLVTDTEPIACCNLYTFNNDLLLSMDISLSKCPVDLVHLSLRSLTELLDGGVKAMPKAMTPYVS